MTTTTDQHGNLIADPASVLPVDMSALSIPELLEIAVMVDGGASRADVYNYAADRTSARILADIRDGRDSAHRCIGANACTTCRDRG